MGRKDFQNNVADILLNAIEHDARTGIGALHFVKRDKKTRGKLYFRGGAIYAIELSTYTPNVVNRIVTNEYIKEEPREQILQRFGSDPTNWAVVPFALTSQLFPERPLIGYIKDYFLDAFDELYSWEGVNAEFKTNEEPSIPTVPNVKPEELIEKAILRREYLETEVATNWNSSLAQIDSLLFRANVTEFNDGSYTTALLLSVADGSRTIRETTEYLGMTRFSVKKHLFELWEQGVIDIIHPSGLIITHRTPEDIQNNHRPTSVAPTTVTQPVTPTPTVSPTVVTTPSLALTTPPVNQPVPPHQLATPVTAPVSTQPPVPQPATPESIGVEGIDAILAASAGSNNATIAQLASQLKAALAASNTKIQEQKARIEQLRAYQATLLKEKQALTDKMNLVDTRLEGTRIDLEAEQTQLSLLEAEQVANINLLN